jgi:hypothetical protein
MSFNLLRNSRVFFTTAVGTSGSGLGVIGGTGAPAISTGNTREIQVLDGFGFSQNTTSETVTLNETGAAPVRGQRSFNTQLDPVDFNMTTYIRPFRNTTGGSVSGITWGSTTAAVTAGSGASTTLLTAYPANIVTASAATQAYAADYGLNTFIYATSAPSGGTTATFAPIFGADPTTSSYQKLIGIYLVNAGSGYTVAPTITITDPDSGAEATALPTVTASITSAGSVTITAEEKPLWNALFTGTGNPNAWTDGTSSATVVATSSNAHQLQRFGLIILIDTTCFLIDDCVLNTATIDFGIDAIASIQWAGQAKAIRRINAPNIDDTSGYFQQKASETDATTQALFSASASTTTFTKKTTAASFIANKLSVVTLKSNIGGVAITSPSTPTKTYNMPLTGGNLTISNNVSYLTPAVLGVVNQPATYFAGTRAISGSMTAYLRTGTNETAGLLGDLLSNATTDVDPAFYIKVAIGGSSATDRVEIEMPAVVLTIPTIATEQVISTTINFTAQGKSGNSGSEVFDLTQSNEINLTYYA